MASESVTHTDPVKEGPEVEEEVISLTPDWGQTLIQPGLNFIATYGWFLVIFGGILLYLWKTRFEEQLQRWRQDVSERREAGERHKNPDLHIARQEALAASRRRLQEQHDQLSAMNAIKLKEKEEQKRLEKIQEWQRHQEGHGFRSKTRVEESSNSSKPSTLQRKQGPKDSGRLRGDYNPLMGSGGGTSYRADRRNCSSSGG